MEQNVQLLTWDHGAVHGQFSSSGIRPSLPPFSTSSPLRKISAQQITASDLNTITITFPVCTRMEFVMSGDELISVDVTFELCEGRAEQHCYIPVRAT